MSLYNPQLSYEDFFKVLRDETTSKDIRRAMKCFQRNLVLPEWFHQRSINTWSPFELALNSGSLTLIETFLKAGANPSEDPGQSMRQRIPLVFASEKDDFPLLQLLLKFGANPHLSDYLGVHPLIRRIKTGTYAENEKWVQAFLNAGVKTDVVLPSFHGKTPREMAQRSHYPEWLALLDAHDLNLSTPLMSQKRSSFRW